jgi:lysophospholipid acyltransferase (LPLAT)-like uncharacterized protein
VKIRNRTLNRLLAWLACFVFRTLLRTCMVTVIEKQPRTSPYTSNQPARYLYCLWHDMIVLHTFAAPHYDLAALVSRHRDGGYLADAMRAIGVHPVRGSSSKGGADAVKEIVAELDGWHVAITPDGPRGPRHKVKPGILWLASKTGRPIVPTVGVCDNAWRIQGSWTDLTIPKPFSRVLMYGGEFFRVPSVLDRASLSKLAEQLEAEMERLEAEASRIVRGEAAPPSETRRAA